MFQFIHLDRNRKPLHVSTHIIKEQHSYSEYLAVSAVYQQDKALITFNNIETLPRQTKRSILFTVDMMLIAASLAAAFALRYGMTVPDAPIRANWVLFPAMLVIGAATIRAMRLNHIKIHTVENHTLMQLAISAAILTVCAMAVSFLLNLTAPRSVPVIFGAVFFLTSVLAHFGSRYLFDRISDHQTSRTPVAIYGAGSTGEQLAAALGQNGENRPVCFIDDNRQLHGLMVTGLKVHPVSALPRLVKKYGLKRVLIAMPSASSYRRQEIVDAITSLKIEAMELPNVSAQVGNRSLKLGLQAKRLKDLYSAPNPNARNPEVLATCRGKTIFIAGAGGRVGSELAQQLIRFEPAKIILLERSETALLAVMQQLNTLVRRSGATTVIESKTGSIEARARVKYLLSQEQVHILINAAHYGDPQLSEDNLFDVVSTNVLGPLNLLDAAREHGVEQLLQLSSEQVIAPRHLVDRTQRLAEQLLLGQAAQDKGRTQLNLLRFGPTAGPVGDIFPLLEQQILTHNSVTLPDPEMTRFFVTTARAADMILGALPFGADLHARPAHLSKGMPRQIMEFVTKVIDMTGKGVRSEDNPFGVEVRFSGLRPGEELHETCPCSEHCIPLGANPNLLMAQDSSPAAVEHALLMQSFTTAMEQHDEAALRHLLQPTPKPADKVLQSA